VAHIYADDTTLVFHSDNVDSLLDLINTDLSNISNYCSSQGLVLNAKKTICLSFNSKLNAYFNGKILLNTNVIEIVDEVKLLGIRIDHNLKFGSQFNHVLSKLSTAHYFLYKFKSLLPDYCLYLLFNSLVLPHINYCDFIYLYQSRHIDFKRLHKKFTKICYCINFKGLDKSAPDIEYNLVKNMYNFLWKHINQNTILNQSLPISLDKHITRCNNKYLYVSMKNKFLKKGLHYWGPKLWGTLPSYMQTETSFTLFHKFIDNNIQSLSSKFSQFDYI